MLTMNDSEQVSYYAAQYPGLLQVDYESSDSDSEEEPVGHQKLLSSRGLVQKKSNQQKKLNKRPTQQNSTIVCQCAERRRQKFFKRNQTENSRQTSTDGLIKAKEQSSAGDNSEKLSASKYITPDPARASGYYSHESSYSRSRSNTSLSYWDGQGGDFGANYVNSLCRLIDQYVGIETNDKLCYVCPSNQADDIYGYDRDGERFAEILRQRFVVVEPVILISISRGIRILGDRSRSNLANTLSNKSLQAEHCLKPLTTVEEYFQRISLNKGQTFSKVILHDVLSSLHNLHSLFPSIFKTLKPNGKLLIIHRSRPPLITLPLPHPALNALKTVGPSVDQILELLRDQGLDVSYEVEQVEVTIPTQIWLDLVREKYPSPLQTLPHYNATSVEEGLRELLDGSLRYSGPWIQFSDLLFFITASFKHSDPFLVKKPREVFRTNFIPNRPLAPIYGRTVPDRTLQRRQISQSYLAAKDDFERKIQADVPEELEDFIIERRRRNLENERRRQLREEQRLQEQCGIVLKPDTAEEKISKNQAEERFSKEYQEYMREKFLAKLYTREAVLANRSVWF